MSCKKDASLKSLTEKDLKQRDVSLPRLSLSDGYHGEAGPREGFVWAWELLGRQRRQTPGLVSPAARRPHLPLAAAVIRKFTEQKT